MTLDRRQLLFRRDRRPGHPLSRALNRRRKTNNSIVDAVRGIGATWVRQIDRTYDVAKMRDTLRAALTSKESGPKIIVASSECMLNKQRR